MTFTQEYFLNSKSSRSLGTSCINASLRTAFLLLNRRAIKIAETKNSFTVAEFSKAFGQLFQAFAEIREFYEYGSLDKKEAVLSRFLLQRLEEEGVECRFDLLSL